MPPPKGVLHDFYAIKLIREKRKKQIIFIEEAKVLFLTSDKKLCRYNYEFFDHRTNLTIPETILDVFLTNMLWIKKPQLNISLPILIGLHGSSLLIDNSIWIKFVRTLEKMIRDESISNKDMAMLFFDNHIEDILLEKNINEINEKFILNEIQENKVIFDKKIKENEEAKIKALENVKILNSHLKKTEKEKKIIEDKNRNIANKILTKIEKNNKIVTEYAQKQLKQLKIIILFVYIIVLTIIFELLYFFVLPNIISLISIIGVFIGIVGGIFQVWGWDHLKFWRNLEEKIKQKKMEQYKELNEIAEQIRELSDT